METSETNAALFTHVPVPKDVEIGGVNVGATVAVTILVGVTAMDVFVGIAVATIGVTVVPDSTGTEFGNEQADIAIKMVKRKIWNLKFFIVAPDIWFVQG